MHTMAQQQQLNVCIAIAVALMPVNLEQALAAATANPFYKGKQIHLIVSTGPAGGYNTYARLVAQHMSSHIPGNPAIIVQNMEGASGIKATSYITSVAARDGTVIAATHNSIPTAPLVARDAVRFDVNKLSWIGSVTKDSFVGYVWNTAPIQTIEDAKTKEIILGGNAPGSPNVDYTIVSNALFGTKFKLIRGYPSIAEINLAMRRGEVQGNFSVSWSSLKTTMFDWLRDRQVRVIAQFGFTKHPELPDVLKFLDQAKTEEDRQLLEVMLAPQEFSKPYFAPPEVPAERLEILRRAFDATMKDPNFIMAAKKLYLNVDSPMPGAELAALVAKLSQTPVSVGKRVEAIFAAYGAAK
jgi:tripartite-type tricarboxylate transporter receptor subunit TctC